MSTENQNLETVERSLVANLSEIRLGTIVKAWRGSKGLDYIVVGVNKARKEIYAIKHNCINQDGSIHKAVSRHNRVFQYETTMTGRRGIVKGITSVVGEKASLNVRSINNLNASIDSRVSAADISTISLYTAPLVDHRSTSGATYE